MRIWIVSISVLLALVCRPAESGAAAPASTRPSEAERARQVVRDLADVDPEVRHHATLQLNSLGADAMDVIEAAVKSDPTPERQIRLRRALKILRPRAAVEWRDAEIRGWEAKNFHDAYDHAGHRGAAWDALAHRAIDLYVPLGDGIPALPDQREAALAEFRKAVEGGCGDPMIQALYRLAFGGPLEMYQGPVDRPLGTLIHLMEQEKYPAAVVFPVAADYVSDLRERGMQNRVHLVELLGALAKTPGMNDEEFYVTVRRGFDALGARPEVGGVSRELVEEYKKLAPGKTGPLMLDAMLNFREASVNVNLGASWQDQAGRVKEAMKLLSEAEKLAPADPRPRNNVLTVQYYLPGGSPEEFEQAFGRAVELDPDRRASYDLKMQYLSPDRGGNAQKLLEFGRQCLATENWRGNVPFKLIEVHELLASQSADTAEYFARPEVWQDVRDVYEGYLVNFPDDVKRRCEFAKYATRCGKWVVAHRQFEVVGDRFDLGVFPSKTSYDYLRKKAARLAATESQPAK